MARLRKRKDTGNYTLNYVDPSDGRRYQVSCLTAQEREAKKWMRKLEERMDLLDEGVILRIGGLTEQDVYGEKVAGPRRSRQRIKLSEYQEIFATRAVTELELAFKTRETYENAFKSFKKSMGDPYLDDIDPAMVRDWKDGIENLTTQAMYGRSLKAAFNRAIEWEYMEENPFDKVRLPTKSRLRRRKKSMSMDEVARVLGVIEIWGNQQFMDYVQVTALMGNRRGESLRLQWRDIDLKERIVIVTVTKKRQGPQRELRPISGALADVLTRMGSERKGYLFKTDSRANAIRESGRPWSPWHVSRLFKKALKEAELEDKGYTLHSLRSSYVTYLSSQGVPREAIQRLVGHSSSDITDLEYDATDALTFRHHAEKMKLPEPERPER